MAVKYQCPNCERRFVDWGAEKLGYKCPECENSELLKLGGMDDAPKAAPPLKRKTKAATTPVPDEALADIEEKDADTGEVVIGDDDLEDIDAADTDVVVDDEPLD